MGNLLPNVKVTKCADYAGAGTTTIDGTEIDMAGWDGVMFIASVGTSAAGNYLEAKQYPATGGSGAALLEGSKAGASKTDMVLDIYRPQERFVTAHVVLGTSSTCEGIWAIQYKGLKGAQTNITTDQGATMIASPDEGTP